jgi:uncharacterized membrane protein YgdD (TMEM256/DUF423 family)
MARLWLSLAAVYGFLAVAFGAFGAHAIREHLTPRMAAVYQTAVQYHFYHALALLGVGIIASRSPSVALNVAGGCFAAGIFLFSGSLYALALAGTQGLGAIAPVGGALFLIGWTALLYSAIKSRA